MRGLSLLSEICHEPTSDYRSWIWATEKLLDRICYGCIDYGREWGVIALFIFKNFRYFVHLYEFLNSGLTMKDLEIIWLSYLLHGSINHRHTISRYAKLFFLI